MRDNTTGSDRKKDRLSHENKAELCRLAKLGPIITPTDAAAILQLSEPDVLRWVQSDAGRAAWTRAQAEGRAELLTKIRAFAMDGQPQAQKLIATLLGAEPADPADTICPAAEARQILGKSFDTLRRRAGDGEWISPVAGGYRFADVLRLVPVLWKRITELKRSLAEYRNQNEDSLAAVAEARRLALLEVVRRRRRENDEADKRLVRKEVLHDLVHAVAAAVREEFFALTETAITTLALNPSQASALCGSRDQTLLRLARTLDERTLELVEPDRSPDAAA